MVKLIADVIALLSLTAISSYQPKFWATMLEFVQLGWCPIFGQPSSFSSAKVSIHAGRSEFNLG
jgi:hypothetical protein